MKALVLPAAVLAIAGFIQSQTLAPELASLAAKHDSDLATLKGQKDAAVDRLRKGYVVELDAAEKKATTAGDLKTAAAVHNEHKALDEGMVMPAEPPPGLPGTLKAPRKAYVDGYTKVAAEAAQREQRIHTDYLRALAALQGKASAGSDLAKQIDAEKEAILQKSTTSTTASSGTPTGTNKLINGNFTDADGDGFPKGWKWHARPFIDPRTSKTKKKDSAGVTFKVVEENKESRVDGSWENGKGYLNQVVEIPSRAKELIFQVHVRGNQSGGQGALEVGFRFFSSANKCIDTPKSLENVGKTSAAAWRTIEIRGKVLDGAQVASILLGSDEPMKASFQFKQAEVKFR